jgi:hypothetical protein
MMEMTGSLEYAVFEDKQFEDVTNNRDYYLNAEYDDLYENRNSISGSSYVKMNPGDVKYYAVSVHMKPESGNEYQGKYCSIDVFLIAVQGNANNE